MPPTPVPTRRNPRSRRPPRAQPDQYGTFITADNQLRLVHALDHYRLLLSRMYGMAHDAGIHDAAAGAGICWLDASELQEILQTLPPGTLTRGPDRPFPLNEDLKE